MSEWVAFGGLRRPRRGPAPASYVKQKMAWARGRQVHWLGYTRKAMLEAFRPFSCDCSSWASGMMYGRITFYFGNGRWQSFSRQQVFDHRLHDTPAFKQGLAFYETALSDFLAERHWHNGNAGAGLRPGDCMITRLPSLCWARYVLDFKKRFGTRIFLAIHDNQVPWMSDAYDFLVAKGVAG